METYTCCISKTATTWLRQDDEARNRDLDPTVRTICEEIRATLGTNQDCVPALQVMLHIRTIALKAYMLNFEEAFYGDPFHVFVCRMVNDLLITSHQVNESVPNAWQALYYLGKFRHCPLGPMSLRMDISAHIRKIADATEPHLAVIGTQLADYLAQVPGDILYEIERIRDFAEQLVPIAINKENIITARDALNIYRKMYDLSIAEHYVTMAIPSLDAY